MGNAWQSEGQESRAPKSRSSAWTSFSPVLQTAHPQEVGRGGWQEMTQPPPCFSREAASVRSRGCCAYLRVSSLLTGNPEEHRMLRVSARTHQREPPEIPGLALRGVGSRQVCSKPEAEREQDWYRALLSGWCRSAKGLCWA